MSNGREELVQFILDNNHSPFAVLGAAVSFARTQSEAGRRIADAADAAIKREIEVLQAEKAITPRDVLTAMQPRRT